MIRNKSQTVRTAFIFVFSVAMVAAVTWFAPSLSAASLNMLFRLRGQSEAPDEIVVVAIDDRSLQRIGQWPWRRSVMAHALDKLTEARPRSVGLDVIYAEPSVPEEDQSLAAAIARNGRVVLPAQLYEARSGADFTMAWLQPLAQLAEAAKAVGHAHVSPGVDGMVRSIQLSKTDDRAHRLWSFGLEVIRIAESIPADDLEEEEGLFRFGAYRIPVRDEAGTSSLPGVAIVRQNEMWINYAGPAGSFRYYSIADLIEDRVSSSVFTDKIVLIGATAESMGDIRVTPFMHYGAEHREGGQEMPGVEIHANIINTIRSRRPLRPLPDWGGFAAALVVILLSAVAAGRFDGWRQVTILLLILLSITAGSLFAFSRYLIIPPLAPMLTGFVAVIPFLLNRALAASRELDLKLAALVSSQQGFLPADDRSRFVANRPGLDLPRTLAWKLRAVDDLTVRLLARMSFIDRILSSMGEGVLVVDLRGRIVFANREATALLGCGEADLIGANFADSLIGCGKIDQRRLYEAIEGVASGQGFQIEFEGSSGDQRCFSLLLSALVTDPDAASAISSENPGSTRFQRATLRGRERSTDARHAGSVRSQEGISLFQGAVRDGMNDSSEDSTRSPLPAGNVVGAVVLISDVTRRVELDRMKTETLQLVSHELRTPLTSIQALSNVLIKFPVNVEDTHEMLKTIHSEAVRLRETINRYLDLTRLESGAQILNLMPASCQKLVAGCLRNLSPLAAERRIGLISRLDPAIPILQIDAPLLTQAVNNLLSNAIKYSPPDTEIVVAARLDRAGVMISVQDQGYGIPQEAHERIFEKFYRLERDTASGIVGTGLGLPLVREIVERHGGHVTFDSAPMAGSTFTIHLPLHRKV